MEEDTEYLKLPIEGRCVHKAWKARVNGYEEAKKLFSQIDDEKSPEWNKFLGLLKKMVVDSNVVAQEKGLEAVLAYVENSAAAGKAVGDVMSGLVTKCIGAPKAKTKELAAQIALMYVEIEKHEIVLEELLKGTEQKNPKIVSGCINLITQGMREFGIKVITIKPILKRLPQLIEDRDKTVREETKALIVEMYRWIGVAINPQLTFLKPIQMTELEAEFEKVKGEKATPTRYLRSQQAKQAKIAAETGDAEDGGDADECDEGGGGDVDPYELMVAVDILSRLPKDFYEKVEAKKWQERKEALDAVEQMLQGGPKLENGDYGDLVRALKKMITKDSNVVIVALATKILASIANGLKKRFQPYAVACISGLLEKFKEKKQNVVTALREAVDAIFVSTTLEAIQEDVLAALENKNPSVKAETAAFLARCFTKCTPAILNKKLLKAFSSVLLKTINESDPTVRDASAEALGTAMKVVGEKGIAPFLADVDKLKMDKIKEACDKAELQVKQPKVVKKAPAPAAAPAAKPSAGSAAPKPVRRPGGPPAKKPASAGSAAKKAPSNNTASNAKSKPVAERELSPEEVDEKAETLFPAELLSGLADSNWKSRMAAVEQFNQMLATLDPAEAPSQLLLRLINRKPGLKDTNFQVAKLRLDAVKTIAENYPVSVTAMSCVVTDITEKLSDAKTQAAAGDALTALAEATRLEHVATQVLDYAFTQKNPKVQVEVFNWLGNAIQEFGFGFQPKLIMENVKKGVTAINPAVRSAAISMVGVLSIYMGNQLMLYFDGEKPALTQLISAEIDKHAGETPRNPERGTKKSDALETWRSSVDTVLSGATEEEEEAAAPVAEAAPPARRVDLSPFLNEAFISELSDKNWKVRAEAVQKMQNMVSDSKSITSSLGECPPVLAARLVDSNTKIAAAALALCQSLALAMGPDCRHHVRVFLPNFLLGMGDTKTWIRAAAISCINTWGEQCGYREFFEGEMIADALRSGSPTLRSELWGWLAEKLPNIKTVPKEEMVACIPPLLANLEDRNADVRKNAADAVLGVMIHTGYGPLSNACDKLKPGSQGPVKAILEKARGNLPEKPVQKSKSASNIPADKSKVNAKMGPGSTATFVKSKPKAGPGAGAGAKPTGRKKEAEEDTSPLMQNNSMKNQRALDEQKLKTLKWNFTTPREEFVELLRDQMTAAGFNKGLIANMFHIDFKYHLRAIDMLSEDLAPNFEAQRANLDLILKWMTIRFFDTNPSVILKGLEYLQTLFENLNNDGYSMIDNEVASFVPYLIIKIGDPKDAVRNSVKMILRQLWHLSSVQKLFPYLMEGIRSKNARQRAECLEHISVMIEQNGLSACVPSVSIALKEIAKQISDRDNSVRNAALNCIVTAHYHDERALKMVGQISDKEMSLLEERIKRASKNRPVANVKPLQQAPARAPPRDPSPTPAYEEPEEEEEEQPPPPPSIQSPPIAVVHGDTVEVNPVALTPRSHSRQRAQPARLLARPISAPCTSTTPVVVIEPQPVHELEEVVNVFTEESENVEEEYYEEEIVENHNVTSNEVDLVHDEAPQNHPAHDSFELTTFRRHVVQHVSYDEQGVYDTEPDKPRPISGPYGLDQDLLQEIETQPVVCPQPKLIEFDLHFLKETSTIVNPAPKMDPSLILTASPLSRMPASMTLEWYLTQIGNRDIDRAMDALAHIESLLVSDQHKQLYQHEDLLVAQLVRQLEFLNQSNHPEVVNCYKRNLGLFVKFFNQHPELSRNVRESTLRDALKTLITLLTEKRLEILEPGTDMFVRVVNNVIIRVLDKSDHTAAICALIKNLYDTVNNPVFSLHYQELMMKCIWKVIKFIDSWADELQYDLIFTDIHAFLRDYPSSWWKKQPSDTPLRTIKTIMHTIVKVNGPVIGEIVRNVRGVTPESELWTYVQKLLKHIKCTNDDKKIEPIVFDNQLDNKESVNMSKSKRMSKNSHDLLSEIFRKIGTKDETNEGIRMLYEFKQQYPEADISPFLQKSSQFFQDYIERGLKSIEADRRLAGVDVEVGKVEVEDKDSGAYLQRLRAWQAKAGWHNAPPASTRPTGTPLSPPRQELDLEPLPVRHSQLDSSFDSTTADESEVEALRKRLEKVKNSLR